MRELDQEWPAFQLCKDVAVAQLAGRVRAGLCAPRAVKEELGFAEHQLVAPQHDCDLLQVVPIAHFHQFIQCGLW
jgi:hypothetical protein